MSESTISVFIAAGILIVLALFIPFAESLARILRRNARKPSADQGQQATRPRMRNIA